jgi:hypothetical protein
MFEYKISPGVQKILRAFVLGVHSGRLGNPLLDIAAIKTAAVDRSHKWPVQLAPGRWWDRALIPHLYFALA